MLLSCFQIFEIEIWLEIAGSAWFDGLKELAIFETALVATPIFINNLKHDVFGQS
jgi:hypothetical protein